MSSTVSDPFSFAEVQTLVISHEEAGKDPARWRLGATFPDERMGVADGEPLRLMDRWIYVFQRHAEGTMLFAEYAAEKDTGNLHVLEGDEARSLEVPQRPGGDPTGSPFLTLPVEVTGQRAYYWFLASRVRLSAGAIKALEGDRPAFCRELDLTREDAFLIVGKEKDGAGDVGDPGRAYVRVVDFETVANALASTYAWACNAVVQWTSPYEQEEAGAKAQVERRVCRYMLAKMLLRVCSDDPKDELDLRDDLRKTEGIDHDVKPYFLLEQEISSYELTRDARIRKRDDAALPLLRFLDCKWMPIIEGAYRAFPGDPTHHHASEWLAALGRWLPRLLESQPGRAYLARILADPMHMVNLYVLPTKTPTADVIGVARKQVMVVFALWEVVAPVIDKLAEIDADPKLLGHARLGPNLLFGSGTVISSARSEGLWVRLPGRVNLRTKVKADWSSFDAGPKARENLKFAAGAMARLTQAIEVVNLGLAVQGLAGALKSNDPEWAKAMSVANVLGSTADFAGAWKSAITTGTTKAAQRGIAIVALIGAIMDLVCATDAAVTAYQRGDYDHMAGQFVIAAGAAVSAVGALILIFAAGSAVPAPPLAVALAIVGAVVSAVGWVWTTISKDSDLEVLVAHCEYGRAFGSGSDAPSWAGGPLSEWKSAVGPRRQLRAIHHLLAAFLVQGSSREGYGVRLTPGMISPDSRFTVQFDLVHRVQGSDSGRRQRPRYIVDWGTKSIIHLSTETVGVSGQFGVFGQDDEGRECVDVLHPTTKDSQAAPPRVDVNDHDWVDGDRPEDLADYAWPSFHPYLRVETEVQLDLQGGGALLIPSKPVEYIVLTGTTSDGTNSRFDRDPISSKDGDV